MTTEYQCQSPGNNSNIATPNFNVTITANSTTDHCNYNCYYDITISIQSVSIRNKSNVYYKYCRYQTRQTHTMQINVILYHITLLLALKNQC